MKLGDMPFKDSRKAELIILPIIDKLKQDDEEIATAFDIVMSGLPRTYQTMTEDEQEEYMIKRLKSSKTLTTRLTLAHYDETCKIIAALNMTTVKEVEEWPRHKINDQLAEMLRDGDLQSFFMSDKALALAVRSVTLPK